MVGAADTGRRVAYELHPSELEDAGLEEVLRAHCENIGQSHGFAVTFRSRNLPQGLSREIASCLYRVAQESLRNVAKHAKARKATVTLEGTADAIRLRVEDTGAGFPIRSLPASAGLGVVGMKERVRLVNGKFSITSEPGKGTLVSVEVPR